MSLLSASGGAGDIWSTGAFSFESPLKDLLDGGEYTTEDLLAQDELLQELRGLHPTLTQYFGTEQAVTQLLQYVVLGANDSPPEAAKMTPVAPSDALTDEPDDVEMKETDNENNKNTAPDAEVTTPLPPGEYEIRSTGAESDKFGMATLTLLPPPKKKE